MNSRNSAASCTSCLRSSLRSAAGSSMDSSSGNAVITCNRWATGLIRSFYDELGKLSQPIGALIENLQCGIRVGKQFTGKLSGRLQAHQVDIGGFALFFVL